MSFYKSSTTKNDNSRVGKFVSVGRILIVFSLLCGIAAHADTVCYVNGNATGGKKDGTSWADAYTNPQPALRKSCPEIWVAKGVYKPIDKPVITDSDRLVYFDVNADVTMYGGFVGTEMQRDDRLPAANVTILSGDIDSNDAHSGAGDIDTTPSDIRGLNSYHVVLFSGTTSPISSSTVLDGFTITGGSADDSTNPLGSEGGGIYCAGVGAGSECSPTLRSLTFSGNNASNYGGALFADSANKGISSPSLINVTFAGNQAGVAGGAMYSNGDGGTSSPALQNVFFNANSAPSGGAMFCFADSTINSGSTSPLLSSVMFVGNVADVGGAMYIFARSGGEAGPVLSSVTFSNNTTPATGPTFSGGAIYSNAQEPSSLVAPTFVNVTFSENESDVGGAIANIGNGGGRNLPHFFNVTFNGNTAAKGGAMYNLADHGSTNLTMSNVILWNDGSIGGVDSEISNDGASASLDHAVFQGGCPLDGTFTCSNIFVGDPLLGTLAENGGFTRTLLPGFGSSAIDTGDDTSCPASDQRGVIRPQGLHCEIGAVEVVPPPPPVAQPLSISIPENTAGDIMFVGVDSNPGGPFSFTFAVINKPKHGALGSISGGVTYIPDVNYTGPDSFTYTATDINGPSAAATVSIQVTAILPVADQKTMSVPHNTSKDVTLTASDGNAGGPFTYKYAVATPTTHGTVTIADDVATYTPVTDYTGPDSFTYTATDVNGPSVPVIVTIQVAPALPVAAPRVIVVPYNTSKSVTFGATDSNLGGPFKYTFAVASVPTHGTIGKVEGDTSLYTPTHGYSGSDAFTYTVTDINGISVPATVTITVLPPGGGGGTTGSTTAIPTLSTWSLLTLAGLLGLTCVWRKRNT